MKNKDIIETEEVEELEEVEEKQGSTLEKGNYIIEVISEENVIRKMAVANAEINITQLADGGMTVDLK